MYHIYHYDIMYIIIYMYNMYQLSHNTYIYICACIGMCLYMHLFYMYTCNISICKHVLII